MTATLALHPFDAVKATGRPAFKVADIALAEWGRKEIRLAEFEMPGLMALRAEFGAQQPNPRVLEQLAVHAPRERPVMFLCRSGVRSHAAAIAATALAPAVTLPAAVTPCSYQELFTDILLTVLAVIVWVTLLYQEPKVCEAPEKILVS